MQGAGRDRSVALPRKETRDSLVKRRVWKKHGNRDGFAGYSDAIPIGKSFFPFGAKRRNGNLSGVERGRGYAVNIPRPLGPALRRIE